MKCLKAIVTCIYGEYVCRKVDITELNSISDTSSERYAELERSKDSSTANLIENFGLISRDELDKGLQESPYDHARDAILKLYDFYIQDGGIEI